MTTGPGPSSGGGGGTGPQSPSRGWGPDSPSTDRPGVGSSASVQGTFRLGTWRSLAVEGNSLDPAWGGRPPRLLHPSRAGGSLAIWRPRLRGHWPSFIDVRVDLKMPTRAPPGLPQYRHPVRGPSSSVCAVALLWTRRDTCCRLLGAPVRWWPWRRRNDGVESGWAFDHQRRQLVNDLRSWIGAPYRLPAMPVSPHRSSQGEALLAVESRR